MKYKYLPNTNVLKAVPKKNSSWNWKEIVHNIPQFKKGFKWEIGIYILGMIYVVGHKRIKTILNMEKTQN